MKTIATISVIASAAMMISCGSGKGPALPAQFKSYDRTESGLVYKIHVQNPDAKKPVEGDFVTAIGVYTVGDTTFFDSRNSPSPYIFPIMASTHMGDIFEGLKMLGIGDSATFVIPSDSLFLKTFGASELPDFVDSGSWVQLDMKIVNVQTKEEFELERQKMFEEQQKMDEAKKLSEATDRDAYLQKNNITAKPTASGLYYIEKLKGKGPKPVAGQRVKVHYTGTLLDGTKFDSSVDRGEPFEFVLGQGQVIPGWDEGIGMMNQGGKATFIIPSEIGYGGRSMGGSIPAYSTLIFDVELVEVIK
jgi:FKBP-type peptidyl-prolyl cis-trans isomerase